MASPAKKVRKANFSAAEISVLTEKFEEHMEVLQSKYTTTVTNARKNKIWEEIADAVNAVGVTARSTQELRDKWKNLQSTAKREFSSFKCEHKKTGGGPAPPNPSEASVKIISMFQDTPSFAGIQGFIDGNIFVHEKEKKRFSVSLPYSQVDFAKKHKADQKLTVYGLLFFSYFRNLYI